MKKKKRGHPSTHQSRFVSVTPEHPNTRTMQAPSFTREPVRQCKNCRRPLATPWELAVGSCQDCIDKVDDYIRQNYCCIPNYLEAFDTSGYNHSIGLPIVRLVPMYSLLRYEFLRPLLRIPVLRGFVRASVNATGLRRFVPA